MKEEVDFDPANIDPIMVALNVNDKKNSKGKLDWAIFGSKPWIIDEIEDNIETALGMNQLSSLHISYL